MRRYSQISSGILYLLSGKRDQVRKNPQQLRTYEGHSAVGYAGRLTRAVRKLSSHFEYLENSSRGLDVTK